MTTWASPLKMFAHVYQHEVKVTGLINKLVDLAIKEKDHATNNFLQWFVKEQVEEEATASEVLGRLKLIGKNSHGLLMYDRELAQRMPLFTFPVKSGSSD
jgi:ferritin